MAEATKRPGRYFGTDGYRGEAGTTLTAENAFRLGRFLGFYYNETMRRRGNAAYRARVAVGKDTRRSGYMLEYAVAAGLAASGADAYLLHVTTTPSVSFVTRSDGFDGGIMISASHNPFGDNGIKVMNRAGEKEDGGVLAAAEDYLDGAVTLFGREYTELPAACGEAVGRTVDYVAGRNRYIGYLLSHATYSLRGVKVGLDCANGSTFSIARAVFDALGATTHVIGADPNGTNINRACGSTAPEGLTRLVRDRSLDVGFAFDGDADRCIAVDERGQIVDGAAILYAAGVHMKREGVLRGGIVSTVMANEGLAEALAREEIPLVRTPVGDKYVYAEMTERGWCLGGEPSGHVIFSKYQTTGDGLLTALEVLRVMLEEEKPLSALVAPYVPYPEAQVNVRVPLPGEIVCRPSVTEAVRAAEAALEGSGRVLVRASGTEPVVRILVEAREIPLARRLADRIEAIVKEEGRR